MTIQLSTIKRLYAKSSNRCALPKCDAPIVVNGIPVGEICHIRARRKNGPRYDATLSAQEKDAYSNLLLLCRTCHKLIDSDPETYTHELLYGIKQMHEVTGNCEISAEIGHDAVLLLEAAKHKQKPSAKASGRGIAIAVGGDVYAPIRVCQAQSQRRTGKYPSNAIGADANMTGYIDYLFGLAVDYWKNIEAMTPGRLGKKIKRKFRLKTKTRYHLPVERFQELADFIISELLVLSPAGKRHTRNGTKLCRTFSEWRQGPM